MFKTQSHSLASQVDDFLKKEGMHHAQLNTQFLIEAYLEETQRGLEELATRQESSTSLRMLPTYLCNTNAALKGKCVVLDSGGSFLRVARLEFDDQEELKLNSLQRLPMPGSRGYVTKESFFEQLAQLVGPLIDEQTPLGFCFSYPFTSQSNLDGRMIKWNKEINAPEVPGCLLAAELHKALEALGFTVPTHSVLLNDATAVLLAGRMAPQQRRFADFIGYILGTGINLAYSEKAANLINLPHQQGSSMIFSTESGSFAAMKQGRADLLVDQNSLDPGGNIMEKMCSGGYFGELVRCTLLLAAEQKMLPQKLVETLFEGQFATSFSLRTKEVNAFLINPWQVGVFDGLLDKDQDYELLYLLIDRLMQRAATLMAITSLAAAFKTEKGRSPLYPLGLVIDGSSYYNYHCFRERVNQESATILKNLGWGQLYLEPLQVDNAPLVGAAVAALTQKSLLESN